MSEDDRFAGQVGARLRRVRQQQGLSLHDVEAVSRGELKASVVGAYERGERTVSVLRLHRLADFYRVPLGELLPDRRAGDEQDRGPSPEVVIDLVALEEHAPRQPALSRYVSAIQARRGDYNGRVLTVRAADLATLAAVMDTDPTALREQLATAGIVR